MANDVKYIKRIKLSDGQVFTIKDENALPTTGGTLTGDLTVDTLIKSGKVYILSTEYTTVPVTNVLTEIETTHEIQKRDADELLSDIGGISYSMNDTTGTLSLKFGKQ